jgi:hypothetical protein
LLKAGHNAQNPLQMSVSAMGMLRQLRTAALARLYLGIETQGKECVLRSDNSSEEFSRDHERCLSVFFLSVFVVLTG